MALWFSGEELVLLLLSSLRLSFTENNHCIIYTASFYMWVSKKPHKNLEEIQKKGNAVKVHFRQSSVSVKSTAPNAQEHLRVLSACGVRMQEKKQKSSFLGFQYSCLISFLLLFRPKLFCESSLKFVMELVPDVCHKP